MPLGTSDLFPDEPTGATIDGTPWEEPRTTAPPRPGHPPAVPRPSCSRSAREDRRPGDPRPAPRRGRGSGAIVVCVPGVPFPGRAAFLVPAVFFLRHPRRLSAHRGHGSSGPRSSRSCRACWGCSTAVSRPGSSRVLTPRRPRDQPARRSRAAGRWSRRSPVARRRLHRPAVSSQARRYADRPATRRWSGAIVPVAARPRRRRLRLVGRRPILEDGAFVTPTARHLHRGSSSSASSGVAWAYLAAAVFARLARGEDPSTGWCLAALAAVLHRLRLSPSSSWLASSTTPGRDDHVDAHRWLGSRLLTVVGYHLALLAAFARGCRRLDASIDDDEDDDDARGTEDRLEDDPPGRFPMTSSPPLGPVGRQRRTRFRRRLRPSSTCSVGA